MRSKIKQGFSTLEFLVIGVVALISFAAAMRLIGTSAKFVAKQSGKEDIFNFLEQRLSLLQERIVIANGSSSQFLRSLATVSGDTTQFDPVLDQDPNTVFDRVVVTASGSLPRVEEVLIGKKKYQVTYEIRARQQLYNDGTSTLSSCATAATTFSVPVGSSEILDLPFTGVCRLSEVGYLVVSGQVRDKDTQDLKGDRKIVLSLP